MDLLVGIASAVSDGHDKYEKVRMLLCNFRKDLDEIERPVLPRVLLCVGQAVVLGLELVQQQHGRSVAQQF